MLSVESKRTVFEKKKKDRFFCGRQVAFMIYDNFRVAGAHATVLDYADLFSFTVRKDDFR